MKSCEALCLKFLIDSLLLGRPPSFPFVRAAAAFAGDFFCPSNRPASESALLFAMKEIPSLGFFYSDSQTLSS